MTLGWLTSFMMTISRSMASSCCSAWSARQLSETREALRESLEMILIAASCPVLECRAIRTRATSFRLTENSRRPLIAADLRNPAQWSFPLSTGRPFWDHTTSAESPLRIRRIGSTVDRMAKEMNESVKGAKEIKKRNIVCQRMSQTENASGF